MDSRKAEGMRFTINLITPDNGEKFLVEMENATLTNTPGFLADKPDLTITVNRADLEPIMAGAKTLDAQIASGALKLDGDASVLKKLASTMVDFDPRFQIMPGTKVRETGVPTAEPFEVVPQTTIAE
jgi:alkyl sulfatase BDS1-like metallo-beta-lactamase superfamily hydrolase